jgi:hypothetical protein
MSVCRASNATEQFEGKQDRDAHSNESRGRAFGRSNPLESATSPHRLRVPQRCYTGTDRAKKMDIDELDRSLQVLFRISQVSL